MGKFISGTILSVMSLVLFWFGTTLLLAALGATEIGEALAGIVLIPVALFAYLVQLVFGGIAQGLLWSHVATRGRARVAGAIVACVCAAAMIFSIGFFAYLVISSAAEKEPSALFELPRRIIIAKAVKL